MEVGALLGATAQRTLAAIVFTDAVDFSAHIGENEERTVALIKEDLDIMRNLCREFEGQVVKSRGDGLMMLFTSAVQAVSCAVEIQKSFADRLKNTDLLTHRIGIHLGDVLISDGDALGDGVNVAARLEEEAEPGGICMSQTVYDVVKNRLFLDATKLGELKLRNIAEPVQAYKISGVGRSRRHKYAKPHWATLAIAGVLLLLVGVGGTAAYYTGKIGRAEAAEKKKSDQLPQDEGFSAGNFSMPAMPPIIIPNIDEKTSKDDEQKWAKDLEKWGKQYGAEAAKANEERTRAWTDQIKNQVKGLRIGHPVDAPKPPNAPDASGKTPVPPTDS